MILETFVLAIITGFIFRGNLSNLAQTPMKGVQFILTGLILRNIPVLFKLPYLKDFIDRITPFAPIFFLVSFALIALGVLLNISRWPMVIVLAGVILNFIVVMVNCGFMPVLGSSLDRSGYDMTKITSVYLDMNHILVSSKTRFTFLSDIIAVPKPYPFPQILSVGDILMCAGLFIFIVVEMTSKKKQDLSDKV